MTRFGSLAVCCLVACLVPGELSGAGSPPVTANPLQNPDFSAGVQKSGLPIGWSRYSGSGTGQYIKILPADADMGPAVLIADGDPEAEIGLTQSIPVKPGLVYRVGALVRATSAGSAQGSYLQLRFLPSNRYFQTGLSAATDSSFTKIVVQGEAPPDTKRAVIYLYTHREPTPQLLVREVTLTTAAPVPKPVPPVYEQLKDLRLTTELTHRGQAKAVIAVPASGQYAAAAQRIAGAIKELTSVKVPIVTDDSPAALLPLTGHRILLGNRSTNRAISELYNRYYTLLDLRYPGPAGHVVRTLHSPFGNGHNVIFVGGSDVAGVESAADAFIDVLRSAGSREGTLAVGWLARIKLGSNVQIPTDLRKFETWEASAGYGSVGYFGWNSLSKHLAMYYMTGAEHHAREFLRLAFPDEKARRQIADIDGERIENKDDPLAGPYHYNAHMMILFWDLVEESPVFSDEERLRVTNAFARQLDHRKSEGIYGRLNARPAVGSRHGQWSAISLYCLGRYFQHGYPGPLWQHCVESAELHFRPLHEHAWVGGESDNLFWYNTGIAPIFTYLMLTGDRVPMQNGVMAELLRGQDMLISGRQPDWALSSASLGFLHKAADLTGDGRYLLYRQRTGVNTEIFRLGQSFWPQDLEPRLPEDLVGHWSIHRLPRPMWQARHSGLPFEESFQFGSFRSASDASGDFVLIDGFNGASRNPYHTFAILELRLDGWTLLQGYRNQLLTRADGLVEPTIAGNAALKDCAVLGKTAMAVAEVPKSAYCNWRRTLAQRVGRYALVVDELFSRTDAENLDVEVLWETAHGAKTFPDGHLEFSATTEVGKRRTERGGQVHFADAVPISRNGRVSTMQWTGPVRRGQRRAFFSLVGVQPGVKKPSLGCARLTESAAALQLPEPALAVAGEYAGCRADLALLTQDHLFARRLATASANASSGTQKLIRAEPPVDLDWDFTTGTLQLLAPRATQLQLAIVTDGKARLDGAPLAGAKTTESGMTRLALTAGRHELTNARPRPSWRQQAQPFLAGVVKQATNQRDLARSQKIAKEVASLPALAEKFVTQLSEPIVDLSTAAVTTGGPIFLAAGKTVHLLSPSGKVTNRLSTDGPIRLLRWWPEPQLLLVGCADEKAIAFDLQGKRRWVFVSEMDPAVFRAAKTYWFKSAPGHEGIHGLHTGQFIDGKSQAFVGSACTLEILDENGNLVRRMPQFWGKVSQFAIIDGPEGSLNLLAARKYNGTNTVAIINNRTLDPRPRGFYGVPKGATYVPGWSSMNRHHLFYVDLDGDGSKEVVSEINGTWNRVTVWQANGKPLYDASFGAGERIPVMNMRDLAIADLDGDGDQEILTATAAGLVVALDHQCRKLWARRLASPVTVMVCVVPQGQKLPLILVGSQDGSVTLLDGKGTPLRRGLVNGRPTGIATFATAQSGPLVLLTTNRGQAKALRVEP